MSKSDEIKGYAAAALDEAKKAAEDGRKPFYAFVGLNEYVFEQTKALAEKAQQQIDEVREDLAERITKLRAEVDKSLADSREKAQGMPKKLASLNKDDVQSALSEYATIVAQVYQNLSVRGEKLIAELTKEVSNNPVVKRMIDAGEDAAEETAALITRGSKALKDTVSEPAPTTPRTTARPAKKTAPRKSAAKKPANAAPAPKAKGDAPAKAAAATEASAPESADK